MAWKIIVVAGKLIDDVAVSSLLLFSKVIRRNIETTVIFLDRSSTINDCSLPLTQLFKIMTLLAWPN